MVNYIGKLDSAVPVVQLANRLNDTPEWIYKFKATEGVHQIFSGI